MKGDIQNGWWEAPAGKTWKCPECGEISNIEDWEECEPFCEDCGTHSGRVCPKCEAWLDHVWDAARIESGD